MDRGFSFLLWPKREARRPWKQGRKKRGSITCRTDRANEANKMFIIWLCWLFQFWKGNREPEVRTATYGPGTDQSQHAKSSQPYNNVSYAIASSIVIVFSKPFCCRFLFICRDSKEKEKYLDFFYRQKWFRTVQMLHCSERTLHDIRFSREIDKNFTLLVIPKRL